MRKRNKMRGLPSILSFFRNSLNKFSNTGARMLDYIYQNYFEIIFLGENVRVLSYMRGILSVI